MRYPEERIDLKTRQNLIRIALFIFLFPLITHSQIPLNGFCRYQEFSTKVSSSNLFAIDFTSDGWRDIVTLSEESKNILVQVWNKDRFSNSTERYFPYRITDLIPFNKTDNREKRYVFASRQSRRVGYLTFSRSGSATVQSSIQLKSYPSTIDVSDINNNGKQEILVSGNAFLGLSIISESNNRLTEKSITQTGIFSYSAFIDLDYDSYPDIAAFDVFTKTINFFYNDKTGEYKSGRYLNPNADIKEFTVKDINSNGFNDIIYIKENGFEILLGDSVSSFNNKMNIKCPVPPDKFTILDFNGDGYNDIAFINFETGNLYIIFAKDINQYYQPILYFQRKGINEITSFVDRGGRKLAVLDYNGKVYIIDRVLSREEDFSISIAAKPGLIKPINFPEEGMNGIYFIDEINLSLIILWDNPGNKFEKYFSIPISQSYSNVEIDNTQDRKKTFFCYTRGERVIEIFRFDYNDMSYKRRVLYTEGPIEELKLTSDRLKDRQSIFVVTNKYGKILLQSFDFRDFRYVSTGLDSIAAKAETASLSFNIHKEIYYFAKTEDRIYLNKTLFDKKAQPPVNITFFRLNPVNQYNVEVKSFNFYSTPEKPVIAWVSEPQSTNVYVIRSGYQSTVSLQNFSAAKGSTQFYSVANRNDLFLYDNNIGKLKRISFTANYRNYRVTELFDSGSIYSYIVTQTLKGKELLIYSDSEDNLVKFRYFK